ncbi:MAG: hypothetical protein EBR09_16005 [Proteobacteria bacterium]|nr:hypothetical protein [Pseudomonadota bacterium]
MFGLFAHLKAKADIEKNDGMSKNSQGPENLPPLFLITHPASLSSHEGSVFSIMGSRLLLEFFVCTVSIFHLFRRRVFRSF